MKPPKVLCFGEALWDVTPVARTPGGAPMNVALRLAGFGIDTQMLTRIGDDDLGRELTGYMSDHGLDTSHVQVDQRWPTGRVHVDASFPEAVRYEIVTPSAWDYIDANAYLAAPGARRDVVVFGSLAARAEVSRRSLMQLLEGAKLRVFDVNLRPPFDERDTVESLLHVSNWVKLNEKELGVVAEWLGVSGTPRKVLAAIRDSYGIDVVCATLGSGGAMMIHEGNQILQPGFEVPVVDTIGCGDAFLGAWLARLFAGDDPGRALQTACAAGAVVASGAGANPPLTEEKIRAVIGGTQALPP